MAPEVAEAVWYSEFAASPLTVTKPASFGSGDLLIAVIWQQCNPSNQSELTTSADWTFEGNCDGVLADAKVWSHVYDPSDPATWGFNYRSNSDVVLGLFRITGADPAPVIAVTSTPTASTTATMDAPSVDPTGADDLLISVLGVHGNGTAVTFDYPVGMTDLGMVQLIGTEMAISAAHEALVSQASTGVRAWMNVVPTGQTGGAISIAVKTPATSDPLDPIPTPKPPPWLMVEIARALTRNGGVDPPPGATADAALAVTASFSGATSGEKFPAASLAITASTASTAAIVLFGDAHSTTPPFVKANVGTKDVTTQSFTPPADAWLVGYAVHDTASGNMTNTSAMKSSDGTDLVTGGTVAGWSQPLVHSKQDDGAGANNGHIAVSYAKASGVPMTVTTTGTNTNNPAGLYVHVVTDADPVTLMDATPTEGHNTNAVISQAITVATAGARVMMIASDWNLAANMTAGTGQTVLVADGIGAPDLRFAVIIQNAVSAVGSVTSSTAGPTTGNANNYGVIALRPAAVGVSHTANASVTVTASFGATSTVDKPTSASLAVTATLTTSAFSAIPAGASLPITATMAASATSAIPVAASLSVTATLALTAAVSAGPAAASLAITAAIATSATSAVPAAASLALTATLSASAARAIPASASLAVVASTATTAVPSRIGTASRTITATLSTSATSAKPVDASLSITAGFAATAAVGVLATLTITATLSASGTMTRFGAASLTITATRTTSAVQTYTAGAALSVTASLATSLVVARTTTAGLALTVTLSASASVGGLVVGGEIGFSDGAARVTSATSAASASDIDVGTSPIGVTERAGAIHGV